MDPIQFPKTGVGTHQEELFLLYPQMINYHINNHKWPLIAMVANDPTNWHCLEDDFCHDIDSTYDWNVNQAQGSGSIGCTDMVNGVLAMTTGASRDDSIELTQRCECWYFAECYPLWAEMRFKLSSITEVTWWFGFVTGHSWVVHPDDYAVFYTPSANVNIDFRTHINGAGGEDNSGITMVAATWYRLGIHWDGDGNLRWFIWADGDAPQTLLATGIRTASIPNDTELNVGFGLQTDEAVAKTMYVDYIKVKQLRVIE